MPARRPGAASSPTRSPGGEGRGRLVIVTGLARFRAGRAAGQLDLRPVPFANLSGDPEQDFFADGLTEDIITALSRFGHLFVISRNSAFQYKNKAVGVRRVAGEFNVQYVVEGSVRKAGSRVRVTVQLIDAEADRHIWADRYDRELEDIFAIQDEVTSAIVATLSGRVEEATGERAVQTDREHDRLRAPPRRQAAAPSGSSRTDNKKALAVHVDPPPSLWTRASRRPTPGRPAYSARPGRTAMTPTGTRFGARRWTNWTRP